MYALIMTLGGLTLDQIEDLEDGEIDLKELSSAVDRLQVKQSARRRLTDSVETALQVSGGLVVLVVASFAVLVVLVVLLNPLRVLVTGNLTGTASLTGLPPAPRDAAP